LTRSRLEFFLRYGVIVLPLVAFGALGLVHLAAWRANQRVIDSFAQRQSEHVAQQVFLRLEGFLGERANDLGFLSELLQRYPEADRARFFLEAAESITAREPSYHLINYLDENDIVRASAPAGKQPELLGVDVTTMPGRKELHDLIRATGEPLCSPPMTLTTGRLGMVIWYPVREPAGDPVREKVAGAFHVDSIVEKAVRFAGQPDLWLRISVDDRVFFEPGRATGEQLGEVPRLAATVEFAFLGRDWSVCACSAAGGAFEKMTAANARRLATKLSLAFSVSVLLALVMLLAGRIRKHTVALARSEERLRRITEGAREVVYRMTIPEGRYEFVSDGALDVLGRTPEEFYESPLLLRELVHPDERQRYQARWARACSGGGLLPEEFQLDSSTSETLWVVDRSYIVRDDSERPVALEGIVTDTTRIRRAEGQLERERDLVSRILRASPSGIVAVDSEGRLTLANTHAERLLGLRTGEILMGTTAQEEFQVTDYDGNPIPVDHLPFERAKSTGRPVFGAGLKVQPGGGRQMFLSVNAFPLKDEDGAFDGIVATIEDVTQSVEDHLRMRDSEARYRELIANLSSGVVVYEAVDEGRDFIIRDFNNAAERIERVDRSDVIGKRVTEVFPAVDEFGLLDIFRRVWETGQAWEHPDAYYHDGRIAGWRRNYVYRLPSGEIVAVYDDVTRERAADEALRASEGRYRRLVESTNDILYSTDADGTITYLSPQPSRYGFDPEKLVGRNLIELVVEEDRERIAQEFARTVATGEEFPSEMRIAAADGSVHWFEDQGRAQYDELGRVTGVIGILRDITQRKQAEEGGDDRR